MSEFYEARIRAEWSDWTFAAHQAAGRAAAAEELVALRRRYRDLARDEVAQLAASWRPEGMSGPYFAFAAADLDLAATRDHDAGRGNGGRPGVVGVSAVFVKELLRELEDQAPAALAALLDRWTEQRRQARQLAARARPARAPRVALALPRDDSRWPAPSWSALSALDLEAPEFDDTLLRWDVAAQLWLALPLD